MPDQAIQLLTRFRAVDDDAARHLGELLRATAAAVASEQGHLSYDVFTVAEDATTLYVLEAWASAGDAQRHADLVLGDGGIDRVLPLLRERLDTATLVSLPLPTPVGGEGGRAA